MDARVGEIARAVAAAGGRALVVGGWVRDKLRGIESEDVDVEVFGLAPAALEAILARFGQVLAVGRAFGVLQVRNGTTWFDDLTFELVDESVPTTGN